MSFVEHGNSFPPADPPFSDDRASSSGGEPIKLTLTGSRQAVARMIHLLHHANIIAGSAWSRPIATRNSHEVISVAIRYISVD